MRCAGCHEPADRYVVVYKRGESNLGTGRTGSALCLVCTADTIEHLETHDVAVIARRG